jgi:hypothetical protein
VQSPKPLRDVYPELAKCCDDLRAMGFVISSVAVYDESGALVAGRVPAFDPREVVIPAERVIAMQTWARAPEPKMEKAAPKVPRKGKRR